MPFSSIADARDAIQTQFKTVWDAQTPPVPVVLYWDKTDDHPEPPDPWARITVAHGPSTQATLGGVGNRRFRRTGLVTVQVFTEYGGGLTENDRYAKVALDAFEGQTTGGEDTVEFLNVRTNEIGRDGAWFLTNVLAEFQYDEVK